MYYPYLRGKQFELKALKEFSEDNPDARRIIPIIEPVNQSNKSLISAAEALIKNGMKFVLVVNPHDGDFRHSTVSFSLFEEKPELLRLTDKWIPAFVCEGDLSVIEKEIASYDDVMLIFKSCANVADPIVWSLINNARVSYVVNCFGKSVSRRIKKSLLDTGKSIICLDDCFITRPKNADYLNYEDEFFSDIPFYWREENFAGFSDYTAMSSEYSAAGYQPYAIAIHMTYQKDDDEIYIHHFVSDSNMSTEDVRGKFVEAASKAEPFYNDHKITSAVRDLLQRARSGEDGFPGLGYLKKLSVLNHLEVINSVL